MKTSTKLSQRKILFLDLEERENISNKEKQIDESENE
jgi:hypothetical protein